MFKRTRNAAKKTTSKTYTYVRDDLLNVKEAEGHFEDIKTLAREHLDPRTTRKSRNETFAHAMERMGLTEEDIQKSYRFHTFRFNVFAFFLGAGLFMAIWGATQANWMLVIGCIPPMLIFVAQLFNSSFRCFQIRHRELLPVMAWWHHPTEWVPSEYVAPPTSTVIGKRRER